MRSRGWRIWVSHTKRSFGRLATFKTGKIDVESRSHLQRRTPKCSFFLSSCSLLMWRTSITDARINVDRNAFQRPDAIGKASPQFPLRFTVRKSQSKNLCILFLLFRFSSFFLLKTPLLVRGHSLLLGMTKRRAPLLSLPPT